MSGWRRECYCCCVKPADYEFDWPLGGDDGTMLWLVCKDCKQKKRYEGIVMRKYHNKSWEEMMEKKWPR